MVIFLFEAYSQGRLVSSLTRLNNGSTVNSVDVVRGEMECSLYSIVGILGKVSTEDNVCLVK